jgi:hypothetical protein
MTEDTLGGVTPEQLAAVFIKIRDKRSTISAAFKEEDGALKDQQEQIKTALLGYCKETGLDSAKTPAGTIIRSVKTTYWTSDWEAMHKFIMANDLPEFFTKSLNQTNVKDYLKENPDSIPQGLNVNSEYVITIRKPTATRK